MNINDTCVSCIINQSQKVADALKASPEIENELTSTIEAMSKGFSYEQTPPEVASDVYEKMALILNKIDIYDEIKELSTKKALSFVPILKQKLQASDDKFLTATKIAVAGNVIDLAAQVEFDLEEELEKIFHTEFGYNDFSVLKSELSKAKKVLILGDNTGEHRRA